MHLYVLTFFFITLLFSYPSSKDKTVEDILGKPGQGTKSSALQERKGRQDQDQSSGGPGPAVLDRPGCQA